MPSKIFSAAISGLDAQIIEVETDVSYGLRHFEIVGLADKAVQEAKERVGAAVHSSNFKSPHHRPIRVLVSLAPADLKKEGSLYDLPIALGYLLATKLISFNSKNKIILGELALDGKLRPIKGVLAIAAAAKEKGFEQIILPKINAPEAALIKGLKIIGVENLKEAIDYLVLRKEIPAIKINFDQFFHDPEYPIDLACVKGQEHAKRALEIAAGGGHNFLMFGPPGTGKTLLAKSICSILPKLYFEEALEVTKIYSAAGLLNNSETTNPLITRRPFRAPHHTSSETAIIGGGTPPKPGEITLAHRGVLFLDEWPEFHRNVLEALRQPIEQGQITILRAKHSLTLPARFILVAASNPCPCGFYNDPEKKCACTNSQIQKYQRKLSGPLMDRIDLFINVPSVKYEKLIAVDTKNSSATSRKKVEKARATQKQRFAPLNNRETNLTGFRKKDKNEKLTGLTNSEMEIPQIKKYCQVDSKSGEFLKKYIDSGKLSARGYHRVLKVSRTIADLEGSEDILFNHVSEAIMYRTQEA